MHGNGIYFWADGRIYEGEFFNDKKHAKTIYGLLFLKGFGKYIWPDKRYYEGEWMNGK
jgi:hypothetical protein